MTRTIRTVHRRIVSITRAPRGASFRIAALAAAMLLAASTTAAVATPPDDDAGEPPSDGADEAPAEATIELPPVEPPADGELDALAAELDLLELAARRRVTVPADARTLRELLEALSAQAQIPVDVAWEELVSLQVSPDDPPPMTRGSGSLLAVLDALCLGLGVPFARPQAEPVTGRIRLVAPTTVAEMRRTRAYHADALAEEFLAQASEHIDPDGWLRNGGDRQHATNVGGTLLVSAPPSVHRRLEGLLEELRMTRPAAVELSAEVMRVPAAAWRELMMRSDVVAVTPAIVASIAGIERVASPTLVTSLEQEAVMESSDGRAALRLVFRPEHRDEAGLLVRFEIAMEEIDAARSGDDGEAPPPRAMTQGTIPAPIAGPPALVSVDLPGSDRTLVALLRARPRARGAVPPG